MTREGPTSITDVQAVIKQAILRLFIPETITRDDLILVQDLNNCYAWLGRLEEEGP